MTPQYAFRTDDPAALAAYRQARQARSAAADAVVAEAEALGKNNGPAIRGGIFGSGDQIVGLFAADPDDPPVGWVYRKGRELLLPRKGRPGQPAVDFLERHKDIGGDPQVALQEHGLAAHSTLPSGFGYAIRRPTVFEHAGALYAKYTGEIKGVLGATEEGCTWPEIPLSQFYAALEAVQAAEKAEESRA